MRTTLQYEIINQSCIEPVHPGEILVQEFMAPLRLSATALARRISVPGNRISEIIAGRRAISADTALRLAAAFGTSAAFWLNLQSHFELLEARKAANGVDFNAMRLG